MHVCYVIRFGVFKSKFIYFHSVRSVPFQVQTKPQCHGPIIEDLLIIKSVFTVYKYSPNKMAIGRDKINLLIFCWPNFAKNTTEGAFFV